MYKVRKGVIFKIPSCFLASYVPILFSRLNARNILPTSPLAVGGSRNSWSGRCLPSRIVIDKSGANLAGLERINVGLKFSRNKQRIGILRVKYLNNIVEQDHRFIKKVTRPALGFKAFHSAATTLVGIEVAHMVRKNSSSQTKCRRSNSLPAWLLNSSKTRLNQPQENFVIESIQIYPFFKCSKVVNPSNGAISGSGYSDKDLSSRSVLNYPSYH